MVNRRYARFAWGTLGLNLFVIVWGAFVRASGSGAGCGSHWPLCNGEVIPQADNIATLIEFFHRITSGLALIAVLIMVVWAFRAYPKGSLVRLGALASFVFIIIESLIGAGLVLLQYVEFNVSVGRAIWMGAHLTNTLLLTAALTLTAWWASGGKGFRLRGHGATGATWFAAIAGMFVLGVSGAITALGDTLTIAGGISPEENALVATFVQLRVFHPLIAFVVGGLLFYAVSTGTRRQAAPDAARFGWWAVGLFAVQLLLGALNVFLMAPVWLQMVHLFVTMVIWMLTVLYGAAMLATRDSGAIARGRSTPAGTNPQIAQMPADRQ
jgi:cytochrome c oxidase assembly protein subunit 15